MAHKCPRQHQQHFLQKASSSLCTSFYQVSSPHLSQELYHFLPLSTTSEVYLSSIPESQHTLLNYIDSKGRVHKYGDFFPSDLSPFAYNETIAQEYFPLTKEKALENVYLWKETKERDYNITMKNSDIPDNISDINNDILNQVIECGHSGKCLEQCTEVFKIIPNELVFYKQMNLPLPRLCPNCRHYARLKQRNPLRLWHRKCMNRDCSNEFETSYFPDRKEIVYCESCYQQEIL